MKPRRYAALLAALALAAGCGGSDETDYSKLPEAPEQEGYTGPKLSLCLRWTPGAYEMVTETGMELTVTPEGQAARRQKMTQEVEVRLDVGSPNEAGMKEARLSYESVDQKMTAGGRTFAFDSAGPAERNSAELAAALGPLLEADIRIVFDVEDRVAEVRGLNEVWDRVAGTNPGMAQMSAQMKDEMGDQMVRQLLNGSADLLPTGPVGPGDTWSATIPLNLPFVGRAGLEYECRLDDVEETAEGRVAHVAFRGRMREEGPTAASVGPNAVTITDVDFQQVGSLSFDIDMGMITGTSMKQTGRMSMTVQGTTATATQDMTVEQALRRRY